MAVEDTIRATSLVFVVTDSSVAFPQMPDTLAYDSTIRDILGVGGAGFGGGQPINRLLRTVDAPTQAAGGRGLCYPWGVSVWKSVGVTPVCLRKTREK